MPVEQAMMAPELVQKVTAMSRDPNKIDFMSAWIYRRDATVYQLSSTVNHIVGCWVSENFEPIGKSTQTLRKRMAGYISPGPTSWTNQRNHHSIRGPLVQSVSVDVYALPDSGLMHFGTFGGPARGGWRHH